MNKGNFRIKRIFMYIEIAIVFMIAGCLLILINFSDGKFEEVQGLTQEAMLVEHDPDNPVHDQLAQEIMEYRPNSYKMIEIYSEDFERIMKVQFQEDDEFVDQPITDYPDLVNLFRSHQDGHTSITIDDMDEDIYFRWSELGDDGYQCLMIIYISRHVVENTWVFHMICYIILILVFILLIMLLLQQYRDKVEYYKSISMNVDDRLI